MNKMPYKTDLPVLLAPRRSESEGFAFRLRLWHALPILLVVFFFSTFGHAAGAALGKEPVFETLLRWMPLLLRGFVFNLAISMMAMAFGTMVGAVLGIGQVSLHAGVRWISWFVTQFFRNAPWLVLLFFAMFLLPFEIKLKWFAVPLPDWVKATIGLSLPVMANVSEIVRGAVKSLPSGQWEAAESLAFTRHQTMWQIILPQCVKRMLPPWMNLYSILTMATVLASVVGVSEVMTLTGRVLSSEGGRPELLAPFYSFVLILFFAYCYPIARWTVWLEKKYHVIT